MSDVQITFRRLAEDDLTLLHEWLNRDHVARWYGVLNMKYPTLELVREHYLPRIKGEEPTVPYVIVRGGRPIGYIQMYRIEDYVEDFSEYTKALNVALGACGIDLLIGERDLVNRGIGSAALRIFLREVVFANPEAGGCVIGPDPANAVAISAYEKAGFKHLKTVDVRTGDPRREYVMYVSRQDALSRAPDCGASMR